MNNMPDMGEVKAVLERHNKRYEKIWVQVDKLNQDLPKKEFNRKFGLYMKLLNESALVVCKAFYRATSDRNNHSNCMLLASTYCPGVIDEFISKCVKQWENEQEEGL